MGSDACRRWLVDPEAFALGDVDPGGRPGLPDDVDAAIDDLQIRLRDLQERLYAEGERSLLVVLQAIDAGGKDGAIRRVFSGVNPQGCRVASFKAPTEDELAHDFLWRVHAQVPAKGEIGIFNRSHYEDVLVVRVHDLVPESVWRARYEQIRDFERLLVAGGTTIVKLYLHISKDEQAQRMRDRLADPTKQWKFRAGDLAERARWDDYMAAFHDALVETSRPEHPWYCIPADRKVYRDWAALTILVETLEALDPQYPPPEPGLDQIVVT